MLMSNGTIVSKSPKPEVDMKHCDKKMYYFRMKESIAAQLIRHEA